MLTSKIMGKVVVFCLLLALTCSGHGFNVTHRRFGLPPLVVDKAAPVEQWIEQKLDHLNQADTRTWSQRYFSNSDYYTDGGPVFLFIDGESTSNPGWIVSSNLVDNARQFGAHIFQLEHRYYGNSRPTNDLSTENLAYLSSEQALADAADFIKAMNEQHNFPQGTKWVAFGGSYAGSLAAWARLKYPDLIHAAVSSSGPLLAIVDFAGYYEVVGESLKHNSQSCFENLHTAMAQFNDYMTTEAGRNIITNTFPICYPIDVNNQNDISTLYEAIAVQFASNVQYDSKSSGQKNIAGLCDILNDQSIGSEFERLAYIFSGGGCIGNHYSDTIYWLQNGDWDLAYRQWIYQTCTEFGFYQSSASDNAQYMFSDQFPAQYYVQQCPDGYGSNIDEGRLNQGVEYTNSNYQELHISAERVVYIHGSIDPWHAIGLTDSTNPRAPSIYVEGASHCQDMYAKSSSDSPQMKAAKEQITSLLGQWLAEN